MTKVFLWLICLLATSNLFSQEDSVVYYFAKPKPFAFVTNVPGEVVQMVKWPFQKKHLKSTAILAGSTAVLIALDQNIYNGVRHAADQAGLHPEEKNNVIWAVKTGSKETVILKLPGNLNTAFYMLGEGMPTILIAGGMWLQGKINHNYRSLQTASDLTESFITLGLTTQLTKWATGRENPILATQRNGAWRPFVSFSDFQNNKPKYDAFPSGHLATMMATVTILANNYPEKKWIKPVGYSLMALTSLATVNNGVHWLSDIPMGIAMGYISGKIITDRHKKKIPRTNPLLN
ncbi:MAG: phosphatase PAP2 family protein [Sphingobacteriales bacterium]|nr:phosphatase PAP2 family protein [Sphingobacteriales bacterium]MBI3718309.1 phosphatase PAP2 family protein [Sphingobacteriales bacterium]